MKTKKMYVVATYFRVPKEGANSSRKNFGKDDANWAFNESVQVTTGLKKRDITMANIILNVTDKQVEKCNMRPGVGYDELYSYFKTNYPKYFQHIDVLTTEPDQNKTTLLVAPAETTPANQVGQNV